jgi:hypothetical protein
VPLVHTTNGRCPDHTKALEIFNIEDKGWDGSSSGDVMRAFMKFLDQPFPDLRYATFHVMQELAGHPWGVKALFAYTGLLATVGQIGHACCHPRLSAHAGYNNNNNDNGLQCVQK